MERVALPTACDLTPASFRWAVALLGEPATALHVSVSDAERARDSAGAGVAVVVDYPSRDNWCVTGTTREVYSEGP